MDLDVDLVQIQGASMKANIMFPFKSLYSRGGNEDGIKNVTEILHKVLIDKGFISPLGNPSVKRFDDLRKINLFLILNSDLISLNDYVVDDDIGHLIRSAPIIPKCLLIHLIWDLNLDTFFCEVISQVDPKLSLELVDAAVQNIKYFSPNESVVRIGNIITATYACIVKMKKNYEFHKDTLIGLYEKVCEFLKYYTDPLKNFGEKISEWRKNKLNRFCGESLFNLLKLLSNCFTLYLDVSDFDETKFSAYECLSLKKINEKKDTDVIICDYLKKINEMFIETAQLKVMEINVDIFCTWCEYDADDHTERTLQCAIGETAYKLCEIMEKDQSLKTDLSSMLEMISRKPLEINEMISNADRDTFLKNATEKGEHQVVWLNTMLHKDYFYTDSECIKCVCTNIDLLPIDNCTSLLKSSFEYLYESNDNNECIKELIFNHLWNKFDKDKIKEILLGLYSEKELNNKLEQQSFDEQITMVLNKIINTDDDIITNLTKLFFQNPHKFYSRIFHECSRNNQICSNLIHVLIYFRDFYELAYNCENETAVENVEQLILLVLKEINVDSLHGQSEKQAYVNFLREIYKLKILSVHVIILKHITPAIDENLKNKSLEKLSLYLQCLRVIFYPTECENLISPTLLLCAQIIEAIRWDISSFTMDAVDVIQEAVSLQQTVFPYLITSKRPEDRECKWLIHKISPMSPLTLNYFRGIFQDFSIELFDRSLDDENLKICLAFILPKTTLDEWRMFFSMISTYRDVVTCYTMMCETLRQMVVSVQKINTKNSWDCLEYCLRNASSILQDMCQSDLMDENFDLLTNLIVILNLLPENLQNNINNYFLNPLSNLIQCYKMADNVVMSEQINRIANILIRLDNEPLKDLLMRIVASDQ